MPNPKTNRKDWRNLPLSDWNVLTFHAYFADMNRQHYGVETYFPWQNWRAEQGVIKRAVDTHGSEILKAAFDECFRTYTPNREYPILTAGFAISYRINGIIPKMLADKAERERRGESRQQAERERPDEDEVIAWL